MGLNDTPTASRPHIAFLGARNAGKSSVVNAITGQETALVSDIKGTTTDPVYKAMELLPLGPVVLIDTPGMDDTGELGEQRVRRARRALNKADVAVLVVDESEGRTETDAELLRLIREKGLPYIVALNKSDLLAIAPPPEEDEIHISAKTGAGIHRLKERLAALGAEEAPGRRLVGDLLKPGDVAVLVVPIDSAAPKGRLILPQQQTIRDILESGATALVTRETELRGALARGGKPDIVITDSQAFERVAAETPADVPLTSFSILFARKNGLLAQAARGAAALDALPDGARIHIAEGCTHHRQCDDIGTVKLPRWIRAYTGKDFRFTFSSGADQPQDLPHCGLIVHCGGCMLNQREMRYRADQAESAGTPMTNYGVCIAHMQGILPRCTAMFPDR